MRRDLREQLVYSGVRLGDPRLRARAYAGAKAPVKQTETMARPQKRKDTGSEEAS